MTYDELIQHFGSQAAAARALDLSQPSVCDWQKNGIPDNRQLEYQKLTKGVLKADPAVIKKYRALLGASA